MLNTIVVVWRESFEAVLIVGIIISYLKDHDSLKKAWSFLLSGIGIGLALSGVLGYFFQHAETEWEGARLEIFQIALLGVAALLMTHMCIWMKTHAMHLKKDLEKGLSDQLKTAQLFGITGLTALAIAREGGELVIFFYGMGIEAAAKNGMSALYIGGLLGLGLTLVTTYLFYKGFKAFNQRVFFKVSSLFLLLTSSSLLLMATRKLIQNEWLTPLRDTIWDTSFFLDERSTFGGIISTLSGYESTPSLTVVLVALAYWAVTLTLYLRATPQVKKSPTRSAMNVPA
jgi:high-affinity iron transporter